jgi:hypothetical protein
MKNIPKCPDCGNEPISYHEILDGFSTTFDVSPRSGFLEVEGYHEMGFPVHVLAECDCGKTWRLRGVTQITEVKKVYEEAGRYEE